MTKTKRIRLLNELLADNLGRNIYGEPIYKWVQARDMQHPGRTGEEWVERNGVARLEVIMSMIPTLPMLNPDRWVLAKWLSPGSPGQWERENGTLLGYPERGIYFPSDIILHVGMEPTEDLTLDAIGAVTTVRAMKEADFAAAYEAKHARIEKWKEDQSMDLLRDSMTAFGNVPGTRSGLTSFPEARPRFTKTQTQEIPT